MRLAIAEQELSHLLTLGDIADSFPPRLTPDMTVKQALAGFNRTESEALPVFETDAPDARFLGVLSRQDALKAYWEYSEAVS
jgi:hypothetical protein